MGNYTEIEVEFIERTLELIDQYNANLDKYPFEKQFNHTLLLNCMLGLIIMPKEKVVAYIPNERLTSDYKAQIGLIESDINPDIKTLQELIQRLRNSIAHFNIKVISEDDHKRIDLINFIDSENGNKLLASFRANEILNFLKYYSSCLIENIKKHKK